MVKCALESWGRLMHTTLKLSLTVITPVAMIEGRTAESERHIAVYQLANELFVRRMTSALKVASI